MCANKKNKLKKYLNKYVAKSKISIKTITILLKILTLFCTTQVFAIQNGRIMSPSHFVALSGDLHVQIQLTDKEMERVVLNNGTKKESTEKQTFQIKNETLLKQQQFISIENITTSTLVISRYVDENMALPLRIPPSSIKYINNNKLLLEHKSKEIVRGIPLFPDPRFNITQIAVPCQTFARGGLYEMQVINNLKSTSVILKNLSFEQINVSPTITTTTLIPASDERLRQTLEVEWPHADLKVSPISFQTYPKTPVEVTLKFLEVNCDDAWRSSNLPDFWLELVYCGKENTCTVMQRQNMSKSNVLYAEQIRGYPKMKSLKLECSLFGLAGNYSVQLRPMNQTLNIPIIRRLISVDWSNKFIFNVYARSIFPCDPHTGIGVLYQYPDCILEQGDRIRLYAKLQADVASLKPPTSLHYIAEQRVLKKQYSMYFSCDMFTEKYVEYCFVYVSQSVTGAVADVRIDCVPTLPVSDSDTGGWGPWSDWTPCSSNCLGGTRNRYRFCDSPPPRYGAKFCDGSSVETEKCGKKMSSTWDCIYESNDNKLSKYNRTEVGQEIGPGCRCGCIVHLGSSKPKRIIAGATQSCPGRSFWLIKVDNLENISLSFTFLRLPCTSQYIKIRNGPSLSSTLLTELNGGRNLNIPAKIKSTEPQLLIEFYSGDISSLSNHRNLTIDYSIPENLICTGGFLANVEELEPTNISVTMPAIKKFSVKSKSILQKSRNKYNIVHLCAVVFATIIIIISAMLGVQYMIRYRKYHLAIARRRDEGSRLHTPHISMSSLHIPPSRAVSTTTLLSEVIYMVKFRPKRKLRHSILRESVDAENLTKETDFTNSTAEAQLSKCDAYLGSTGSIVKQRNELIVPNTNKFVTISNEKLTESFDRSGSFPLSETSMNKKSIKDNASIISLDISSNCHSSPAAFQSSSKYSDRYDGVTLKMQNSFLVDSLNECISLQSLSVNNYERFVELSSHKASPSFKNGCYSPASSIISTAQIRTTNPKETKEKQNRIKLLARPGSEFSLGNQEELEMDYYDYNVINAAAAPGSYLGMDPAYLIWIPPLEESTDENNRDNDKTPEPLQVFKNELRSSYKELKLTKYRNYLSHGNNTDSSTSTTNNTTPISDKISILNCNLERTTTPYHKTNYNNILTQVIVSPEYSLENNSPPFSKKQSSKYRQQSASMFSLNYNNEKIQLHQSSCTRSARNISSLSETKATFVVDSMSGSYAEKETSVEKSFTSLQNFLALDDIQFADDSENDHDIVVNKIN